MVPSRKLPDFWLPALLHQSSLEQLVLIATAEIKMILFLFFIFPSRSPQVTPFFFFFFDGMDQTHITNYSNLFHLWKYVKTYIKNLK